MTVNKALKVSAVTAYTAVLALFLFFTPLISEAAQKTSFVPEDPVLPLSSVKAGMKAEVRTVLRGTEISRFSATLLGIVPRASSPKKRAAALLSMGLSKSCRTGLPVNTIFDAGKNRSIPE